MRQRVLRMQSGLASRALLKKWQRENQEAMGIIGTEGNEDKSSRTVSPDQLRKEETKKHQKILCQIKQEMAFGKKIKHPNECCEACNKVRQLLPYQTLPAGMEPEVIKAKRQTLLRLRENLTAAHGNSTPQKKGPPTMQMELPMIQKSLGTNMSHQMSVKT